MALQSASENSVSQLPVVVVGAGPVGLTIALDLARQGIRPILLEADAGLRWSSRAICISRRSLEIFERLGVAAALKEKALGWSRGKTFYRDELVFQLALPQSPHDRNPPFVNLQQYYTEGFLLDRLRSVDGADVRWAKRLVGMVSHEDRVTLTVNAGGCKSVIEAAWLVAADGGRSTVRDLSGLTLKGASYEGRYLIADIEIVSDRPVERHVWFDPPSNPGSTVILHVQPDNMWRIDYQLGDEDDGDEALKDEVITARIDKHLKMIGENAPWRLHWKSLYRAHALSLDSYRHGRVLFAGDAAHLVPIFGVRGLNSGIDDAHNLGWKLGMVVRGEADAILLDSYSAERRAAADENIAQATKSTWFMSPPTDGFRLIRDAALALAADYPAISALLNPRQSAPVAYKGSLLTTPDDEAEGVAPGDAVPEWPQDSGWTHDLIDDRRLTVLVFLNDLKRGDAIETLTQWADAPDSSVRVVVAPPDLADRFAAHRWPVYLVRPDEHVAARFHAIDMSAIDRAVSRTLCRKETAQARRSA